MPPQKSDHSIEAIRKSNHILTAIKELKSPGVTELATHLDMPKTTVHAHLLTLDDCGLVTNIDGEYRLSLRFIGFGRSAKNQFDFYPFAKEELDLLVEEVDNIAHLMVEDHGFGVYLYKAEPPRAVQVSAQVGDRRHLHCTALGKVILSNLSTERVNEIIEHRGLPAKTKNTVTDRDELFAELEAVRDQGYAIDDEEIQSGLRCVAVPVNPGGRDTNAAISVSGPTSRMQQEQLVEELPKLLQKAANVIEVSARNA